MKTVIEQFESQRQALDELNQWERKKLNQIHRVTQTLIKDYLSDTDYLADINALNPSPEDDKGWMHTTSNLHGILDAIITHLKNKDSSFIKPLSRIGKKIFISHARADNSLTDLFIDELLLQTLHLDKKEHIFYTSKNDTGVPLDENWRDHIKKNIQGTEIMIMIITSNFKRSEMCLNEMGAAWGLEKKKYGLLVPPISYDNFGACINDRQTKELLNKDDLKFVIETVIEDVQKHDISPKLNIEIDNIIDEFLSKAYDLLGPLNNGEEQIDIENRADQIASNLFAGVPIVELTVEEKLKEKVKKARNQQEKHDFLSSRKGFDAAINEVNKVFRELEGFKNELQENCKPLRIPVDWQAEEYSPFNSTAFYAIECNRVILTCKWVHSGNNSLDGSNLTMRIEKIIDKKSSRGRAVESKTDVERDYIFDYDTDKQLAGWQRISGREHPFRITSDLIKEWKGWYIEDLNLNVKREGYSV